MDACTCRMPSSLQLVSSGFSERAGWLVLAGWCDHWFLFYVKRRVVGAEVWIAIAQGRGLHLKESCLV
jgi:hypothetical protein